MSSVGYHESIEELKDYLFTKKSIAHKRAYSINLLRSI